MQDEAVLRAIESKYRSLSVLMDERMRRQWAPVESRAYGWGGVRAVSTVTGMSPNTTASGWRNSRYVTRTLMRRWSRPCGVQVPGANVAPKRTPSCSMRWRSLVEPTTPGDPESALRWTCKSTTLLARELTRHRHPVSARTVGRLLNESGYSLQSNRKTLEGGSNPDRNAQFEIINASVKRFQQRGQPVISVDTKKKELVGAFKNAGREWQPKGEPEEVKVHDFLDPELGKAIPYGVYDISENQGWVSVGIDHDTAHFAAEAIRRWWKKLGSRRYRDARELIITADGGGSNGSRCRLWKVALQELATKLEMPIHVRHLPPGTSKWNKIEHRMFSHITRNWRGRPLISHEIIIQLIANTTTQARLKIRAELDSGHYPTGVSVTDAELAALNLKRADFHGEWNYTLLPLRPRR